MEERSGEPGVSLLIPSTRSLDRNTPPGRPVRTLGIDLGTTNSTVAELGWRGAGQPIALEDLRCLEIDQPTDVGEYTHILVPSVVALAGGANGGIRVGEGAKRLRARTAELGLEQGRNIFWECKNDIGVRRTYHRAPQGYCQVPQSRSGTSQAASCSLHRPTPQ